MIELAVIVISLTALLQIIYTTGWENGMEPSNYPWSGADYAVFSFLIIIM